MNRESTQPSFTSRSDFLRASYILKSHIQLLTLRDSNKIIKGPRVGPSVEVSTKVFHCWKILSMSSVLAYLNPFKKAISCE